MQSRYFNCFSWKWVQIKFSFISWLFSVSCRLIYHGYL